MYRILCYTSCAVHMSSLKLNYSVRILKVNIAKNSKCLHDMFCTYYKGTKDKRFCTISGLKLISWVFASGEGCYSGSRPIPWTKPGTRYGLTCSAYKSINGLVCCMHWSVPKMLFYLSCIRFSWGVWHANLTRRHSVQVCINESSDVARASFTEASEGRASGQV